MRSTCLLALATLLFAVPVVASAQADPTFFEVEYGQDGQPVDQPKSVRKSGWRSARTISPSRVPRFVKASDGKLTLAVVYASWCKACGKFLPFVEKLQKRYGDAGLSVVLLSVDDNDAAFKRQLKSISGSYRAARVRVSKPGTLSRQLEKLGLREFTGTIPTFALFDDDGRLLLEGRGNGGARDLGRVIHDRL